MTDPKDRHETTSDQTGLPEDLGNGMSSRAGYYDESGSGRRETPVAQPRQDTATPDAVPTDSTPPTGDGDSTTER